ncbi:MAG: alcohol dehydrogenase catalytic domain-containing protein [Dehalococcoidales bacterium]|nr:alcohol dehydrogenase catalytic domain-containing protein [Dehalococcoidales bacterium]
MVEALGEGVGRLRRGDTVGVCWIYHACGKCEFCRRGLENLCADFRATGCHADGGYAEYMVVSESFAYRIPPAFRDPVFAAPLMCSGVVGFRSLKLTGMEDGLTLGLYGFGAANHLVIQMANFLYPRSRKFVFSRNPVERELALSLGADWAGGIDEKSPEALDCAIDTTPAWQPVLRALENLKKGGRLVLNLIRKEDADRQTLVALDYPKHLWWEKEIKTVANVTRRDAEEFLELAARAGIKPEVQVFALEDANEALVEMKSGKIRGAKVLRISW